MQRTLRTFSVTILVALAALFSTAAGAAAFQYPPSAAYDVTCSADGLTVTCTVVGADPGEQLAATAICDGSVRHNMTLVADNAGEASFRFIAAAGTCDVSVLRASSGTAATTLAVGGDGEAAGDLVSGSATDQLPFTGAQVGLLLMAGILLLAAGLITLRRREDARVSATT